MASGMKNFFSWWSSSQTNPSCYSSDIRMVLLGKNEDKMIKLSNFIMKDGDFQDKSSECMAFKGTWEGKPLTLVKTPNIFSLCMERVKEEMKSCVSLCPPGPNVLLLLVKPSDLTDKDRKTLNLVLSLFGEDAFKHSMVIITDNKGETMSVKTLIKDCDGDQHKISLDKDDVVVRSLKELMQKVEKKVRDHRGRYLTLNEAMTAGLMNLKSNLNLVLCGRRGALKTSAAKAILGQTELHSVSNSSECVKHQGEVCGRWVSLVDLPALYGKPQEEVMEQSLRCICHCDPEGVRAFILVLPVAPLTDEDKRELETIQDTFSSRVNDFTMILFTVDSSSKPKADENLIKKDKDLQELCETFGHRHVVLNIKKKQQIPELFEVVDKMRLTTGGLHCYTAITFLHAQMDKILQQEKSIKMQQDELKKMQKMNTIIDTEDGDEGPDCLRIVLIGKTGCGKSSTGNTILGRDEFKTVFGQISGTKYCQKAQGQVDGRSVVVVDTPGLFDTNLTNEDIQEELVKCVSLLAPGPHVFLLVLTIGRLTDEEMKTLMLLKKFFGKNSQKFTIILLTKGDELQRNNMSVDDFIKNNCHESFKKLISDCGGRYHVFNNYEKQDHKQVSELITKIDTMVKENGGNHFTNEMLQEAEVAIKKEMQRLLKEKEEEMQREKEEIERKHEKEMKAMKKSMDEEREKMEQERNLRVKELEEMENKIRLEQEKRTKEQEIREKERKEKEAHEERLRREFIEKLEIFDKQIQLEKEEKKSVDTELKKSRDEMRKKQEAWEKERKEEQKKQKLEDEKRREEEQKRMKELQEKYNIDKQTYEINKQKEDEMRREQEEKKRKEQEETHQNTLQSLKKKHEDDARKKAEEFNEAQKKHKEELATQKKEHEKEMYDLVKRVAKKGEHFKMIRNLLENQEKEMKKIQDETKKKKLQETNEIQITELIQNILKEEINDTSWCSIL